MAAIALVLPLGARYITKNILEAGLANASSQIYLVGIGMLLLILIYALCNSFVDYQGHMMGAKMERDMRAELFAHYQKLPLSFFDDRQVGQLMSRITHDTFAIGELYHHGT
ncbi:MAG: ABC transporter transmembrane domain-containing protein [Deinococcales bacterium]